MSGLYEFPPLSDFPALPGSDEDQTFLLSPSSSSEDPPGLFDLNFSAVQELQGSESSPKESKSLKMGSRKVAREERQEIRKVKHRIIDRKRRQREKASIDELRDLVLMHPSEKPDKATIVAGAVRTIKDMQLQIAQLEARLTPSMCFCKGPCSCVVPHDFKSRTVDTALPTLLTGLATAGVAIMVIDFKDSTVVELNDMFENLSGFRKEEVLGRRFSDSPLFGRYVQVEFPPKIFSRSLDPHQSLIPTASSEDYTAADHQRVSETLSAGGNWRVVCRWMTRTGFVVESNNTLCLWRGLGQAPSIMHISTPDQRRYNIPPWLLPSPSGCQVPLKGEELGALHSQPVPVPQPS